MFLRFIKFTPYSIHDSHVPRIADKISLSFNSLAFDSADLKLSSASPRRPPDKQQLPISVSKGNLIARRCLASEAITERIHGITIAMILH